MKRILTILSLLISNVILQASPIINIRGGRLFNCGNVVQGEIVSHTYTIVNEGDDDLHFFDVIKTCNCTDVFLEQRIVEPQDSTRVTLKVDTSGKSGDTVVDVILKNDSGESRILKMRMNCVARKKSGEISRIVKRMAKDFAHHYSKNYGSRIRYTYTVEANGRFREFMGYEGYLLSLRFTQHSRRNARITDPNRGFWFPVSGMRSFPWNAERDDTLQTRHVVSGGRVPAREQILTDYNDAPSSVNVFDLKRAVEVCSPLNPRHVKHFDYWLINKSSQSVIIGFKTKENLFPRKVRIYGSGELEIDPINFRVKGIKLVDYIDYWSSRMHSRNKEIPSSLTSHVFEAKYISKSDNIFSSSVSLKSRWRQDAPTEASYYITPNRRRKPCHNSLVEDQRLVFDDQQPISKKNARRFDYRHEVGLTSFYAEYIESKWTRETTPWLPWDKMESDLNINGWSLRDQARRPMNFNSFGRMGDIDDKTSTAMIKDLKRNSSVVEKMLYHETP